MHCAAEAENLVIIGSGPAGYTAAIYAARANLKPVVFEGFRNGRGGQLMTTTEVENFPGFPEGITGPDLMDRMRKQAERWGSELHTEDVEEVDLSVRPFRIKSTEREVRAHSVVIATGASAKRLGLPSEPTFWSRGISACAICDGASPLFKGGEVAVVGGGDSATEEAIYLTKYAKHVHLLVRGQQMRASKAMQDRTLANPRVTVHFNTGVEDAFGGEVLQGLKLFDTRTGEKRTLAVQGLFYGIGHTPNSKLVAGQVELDEAGYVKVTHGASTSVPGVFAAGDLHDTEWRQAITAAGSGCMAALAAERYLTANGLAREFKQAEEAAAAATNSHGGHGTNGNGNGNGAAKSAAATTPSADTAETFDINVDKHKGQYALRKLYHESKRLICVLYTAPTCGPCRTLKPIFNSVLDEYKGKVHYVEIDIEQVRFACSAAGSAAAAIPSMMRSLLDVVTIPSHVVGTLCPACRFVAGAWLHGAGADTGGGAVKEGDGVSGKQTGVRPSRARALGYMSKRQLVEPKDHSLLGRLPDAVGPETIAFTFLLDKDSKNAAFLEQQLDVFESLLPRLPINLDQMRASDWARVVADPDLGAKLVLIKVGFPALNVEVFLSKHPRTLLWSREKLEANIRQVAPVFDSLPRPELVLEVLPELLDPRQCFSVVATLRKWYPKKDPLQVLQMDPDVIRRAEAWDVPLEPVFFDSSTSTWTAAGYSRNKQEDWQVYIEQEIYKRKPQPIDKQDAVVVGGKTNLAAGSTTSLPYSAEGSSSSSVVAAGDDGGRN
ncbi:hypothetical protein VOLCADRAFT_103925 [Volvox carteri f. nagariensis]|uniref:Thioredoxin reductase n=1 Tax=Volvox carteri f. nagariensis TaxID=3068 RepID=D8TQ40_VOLCA|nr:uncharacterized protein VOLCADRAFT_103925 [Volvox carteri f. nagariensis]EFJ50467.1 hypothetical protein VOLCADRAFT_103925 [Volvox carteri f. nagariensis]|eukprot:XP_002948592.1 hypothetical protein VOLCADRAFT_103925 [Volvox carteri f. nagariensis]